MKAFIFVPSTNLFRGCKLANQAGFFYFPAIGILFQISSGLPYRAPWRRTTRESGFVDTGNQQAAFFSAYKCQQIHDEKSSQQTYPASKAGKPAPSRLDRLPEGYANLTKHLTTCDNLPCGGAGIVWEKFTLK